MRWGSEDGTKLKDLPTDPGYWFMSKSYQEVCAAKAWTGNWEIWERVSEEARGIMLEQYRTEKGMEAWELKEQKRKQQ